MAAITIKALNRQLWIARNTTYNKRDSHGLPVRLLYRNENGKAYGYDEFGWELYEEPEKETGERYTKQGKDQPFGYIGYQFDEIGGTYHVQAREYKPELGRLWRWM